MLCLYYTILYYTILYYTILYYTILYYTIQIIQYYKLIAILSRQYHILLYGWLISRAVIGQFQVRK